MWEILYQEKVFKDFPNLATLMHAVIDENARPEFPKNAAKAPGRLKKLIQKSWEPEPKSRPSMAKVVKELEEVILDVTLQDHDARKMWRDKLGGENVVAWPKVAACIRDTLQFTEKISSFDNFDSMPIEFQCLHELVVRKGKGKKIKHAKAGNAPVVKVKQFGEMVQYFGPFDRDFLHRLKSLLTSKWFHGAVSQEDAESSLQRADSHSFLIRFSSNAPNFTLSVKGKKQIEHHRILNITGKGFHIWSAMYKDLHAIVAEGVKKKLFKRPCLGSPYEFLYEKKMKINPGNYSLPTTADMNQLVNQYK